MKLDDILETGAQVEKVVGDLRFLEGPIWTRQGTLIYSDIPGDTLYEWNGAENTIWRQPSRNANGNTLDDQGRLVTCEHGSRNVTRTKADGDVEIIASHFEGKKLNSPNDVVVHPNGDIYFTDPPYGISAEQEELGFYAVFRLKTDGSIDVLADDFVKPNGLAFSPDHRKLYVADTERFHIRAFNVESDGTLTGGAVFASVKGADNAGPDGMRVDENGVIFCTGSGGVHVIHPDGNTIGVIETPETPANCTFGDEDGRTLYITARTSLYKVRVKTPGIRAGF